MSGSDAELIPIGTISRPHGIKGWIKISSQTTPAENIFTYKPWLARTHQGLLTLNVDKWQQQGNAYIAQVKEINNRNHAEALCPSTILIEKTQLPCLATGDYYWHQLIGCELVSEYGGGCQLLGQVKSLLQTGANDVLVVAATKASIDDRERLIPYVVDQFVKHIDIDRRCIVVDWDPEF